MKAFESSKSQSIIIRLMYFLSYAGSAAWLSLFYVYLKESEGLSGFEVGIIAGLQQINMVFVLPVWGMLADSFGRKRMFTLALFLSALFIWGFYLSHAFVFYVLFMLFFTLFFQTIPSLIDSIALDFVELSSSASFGEFRLWASAGWAVTSLIVGKVLTNQNLYLIFAIASVVIFANFLVAAFLYKPIKTKKNLAALKLRTVRDLLFVDWRLTLTLFILFFYGIFSAPTHMFINIYYNAIGGTNEHIGYAYAVQALSELPFFFYGKKLIDRFGIKNALLVTMLLTAIRMAIYGLFPSPWVAIAIGSLHGIGFGLFMVAIVAYIHAFVPAHLRSTGQSFFYVFYFGAGFCVGNIYTGWLKDVIGMELAMIYQAVASAVLILIAVAAVRMPLANQQH